ncbi:hypothetical protein ILUMI_18586 [Ignelater luminosus]|uniref:Transmembrane protein n=1 Tax=Ignelater luminosus TaxID=2038154 RepID=A0A8K0CNW6_IGNLU|nr:hypothetical protein ILUMI_18586 [Ignelater luminosus]
MENIYKIKVRTNPDPRWLYPSERRYSASIVLGLGVVHLALACTALLMACLTLTANETLNNELPSYNNNSNTNASFKPQDMIGIMISQHQGDLTGNTNDTEDGGLEKFNIENTTSLNLENNKEDQDGNYTSDVNENSFSFSTSLTLAPCLMCLGSLAAGLTGLLAWKRWYIDHNIKWFFCMSLLSTVTSTICLIVTGVLVIITNENIYNIFINTNNSYNAKPNTKYVITINILIASILEWLWSILSTKIAFVGMKNEYPDDIVISKSRGKIEVNTVHKGNKKAKVAPPDIINHFPVSSKIAKYFPKKGSSNLPKDESNSEYQERVNKFLSSNIDANSAA